MIQESHRNEVSEENQLEPIQNYPFALKTLGNTINIPVFPRAYIEEVTNIDYARRTVTAKFVLLVTVSIYVRDPDLRKFLQEHLILEFGFNQILFIPEHITLQNSPYLIRKIASRNQDYVTYRIKGDIECTAQIDSMFFPFRMINITNHLCVREQEYKHYKVRYNIMELLELDQKYAQFLPYSGSKYFGQFKIDHDSSRCVVDNSPLKLRQALEPQKIVPQIIQLIFGQKSKQKIMMQKKQKEQSQSKNSQNKLKYDEQKPFQHIAFRFTMSSLSVGFVWQQEIPLWVLSVITLSLYEAQPNIGNKYSNIILLLVSYVSVISNFRRNNEAQQALTFFEWKLIFLVIVPILLIITTSIDYYHMDRFNERSDQMLNPFAMVSLVIVFTFFAFTLIFLFYLWVTRFLCQNSAPQKERSKLISWQDMMELQWGQRKLRRIMYEKAERHNVQDIFDIHRPDNDGKQKGNEPPNSHQLNSGGMREEQCPLKIDNSQNSLIGVHNKH